MENEKGHENMKNEITIDRDALKFCLTAGCFGGLTVSELLTDPEHHMTAWKGLLYCLNGVKPDGGEALKTNTARADVEKTLMPHELRRVKSEEATEAMIDRMMRN